MSSEDTVDTSISNTAQHPASVDSSKLSPARFISDRPCVHGHGLIRYKRGGKPCVECERLKIQNRYAKNPGKWKQYQADLRIKRIDFVRARDRERAHLLRATRPELLAQYERNRRDAIKADPKRCAKERARQMKKQKAAYIKDPEKFKAYARLRRADPIVAEKAREQCRQYKRDNPHVTQALNRKHGPVRRAAKKNRVPAWLTEADMEKMHQLYQLAQCLGGHVDHIIPLQGKLVSGLHVPSNLQILTQGENCSKRNKFEPFQC